MKINDIIYRFPLANSLKKDGLCRVRTFVNSNNQIITLITDIGSKNTSASVTNSIEYICESLIENGFVPKDATFIEHYEPNGFHEHTFDLVNLKSDNEPEWSKLEVLEVVKLLQCEPSELDNLTVKNESLISQIEKARVLIDPYIDLPYQQDSDYILRK